MTALASLQRQFLDYVQTANPAFEGEIAGASEAERGRRLSIYYNAYRVRLRGSIETDHPVLGRYLGDEWFEEMVTGYIGAFPSAQTSLRHFCDALPAFLGETAPFADNPVLADLAAFEYELMDAFDAADGVRPGDDFLASIPPADWPGLGFSFHPSARYFITSWNTVEIWQAIKADLVPPAATQGAEKPWLVWRSPSRLTEFRCLGKDEYAVLQCAQAGGNFASICEVLLAYHSEADVASRALLLLQAWVDQGLILGAAGVTS